MSLYYCCITFVHKDFIFFTVFPYCFTTVNNRKSSSKPFQVDIGEFLEVIEFQLLIVMSSILCFCRSIEHEVYANSENMASIDDIKYLYQTLKTEWNKRKPDFKQCNSILLQIKVELLFLLFNSRSIYHRIIILL